AYFGLRRVQRNVERNGLHQPVGRAVIFQADGLSRVGAHRGTYRIGSAWPITRLIEGERARRARSSASTFSCTSWTLRCRSTRQWKFTISPSSVSRTRTL